MDTIMATAAQRMTALEDGMAAILAAMTAQQDAAPAAKTAAKKTAAKTAGVKRQLDPVTIDGPDGWKFTVTPANGSGLMRAPRLYVTDPDGRHAKGLTAAGAAAVADHADDIAAAFVTVAGRSGLTL